MLHPETITRANKYIDFSGIKFIVFIFCLFNVQQLLLSK